MEEGKTFVASAKENVDSILESIGEESLDDHSGEGREDDCPAVQLETDPEEIEDKTTDLLSVENCEETFFGQSVTTMISCIEDKVDEADDKVGQEESNIETVNTPETQANTDQVESDNETKTNSETEIADDPPQEYYKSEEQLTKNEKVEILPDGYPELLALTIAIFIALVLMFN